MPDVTPPGPPAPTPALPAPAPVQSNAGRVMVVDPQGRLMTVPEGQLSAARAQGYQVASAQTIESQRPTTFGDVADKYATGAQVLTQSLLHGGTAGLADPLINKVAAVIAPVVNSEFVGKTQQEIEQEFALQDKQLREQNPWLYGGGEIAGMVGGSLLGGGIAAEAGQAARGGSFLARAAQAANEIAPIRALETAGAGADALAGRATAGLAARGAMGRAAAQGVKLAARGATEMGIYQGINELSEEMLGEPKVNAEKILAAGLDGAKGGALFGMALGAGGSLAATGGRALQGIASDAASKSADYLQRAANEQRWRAIDPTLKFTREANARIPGGTDTVGATLGKYGITGTTMREAIEKGDVQSVANRIDEAVDKVGARIGELHTSSTAQVSLSDVGKIFDKVLDEPRRKAGFEDIVKSVDNYGLSLAKQLAPPELVEAAMKGDAAARAQLGETKVPIQDLIFQRKALDQRVYLESKALNPNLRVGTLRDIRRGLEDLIVKSFDDAAKETGNPATTQELLGLKRDYQSLSIAQEAVSDSISKIQTHRNFSLSDYLTGGFASHVGAVVGGPVGAAIGGAAGATVNRYLRRSGNAIAANALDRIAAFGGKTRLIADLPEAASALAREASAAEGRAGEVATSAAPSVPGLPSQPKLEAPPAPAAPQFQEFVTPKTLEELGVSGGKHGAQAKKSDIIAASANVFGDKAPTAQFVRDMYRVPPGYSVKVEDFSPIVSRGKANLDTFALNGKILDDTGKEVGNFERTFERKDGKLHVYHKTLELDKSVQGKGIGTAISDSALEAYHQLGVDRIELYAALSAGPYVWARRGFQWDESQGASAFAHENADQFAEKEKLSADEKAKLDAAIDQNPRAVADLKFGDRHIGKEFLLQSGGWDGVLPVEMAHAEMLQKAADFKRAQEAITSVDNQIARSAKAIVEGPKEMAGKPSGKAIAPTTAKDTIESFDKAMGRIRAVQANPESIMNQARVPLQHMPQISQQLSLAMMRTAGFLSRAQPMPATTPSLGMPAAQNYSLADMQRTIEQERVGSNPKAALRQFDDGTMTVAAARALREVSPEIFAQLQAQCVRLVAAKQASGDPITFDARQRMHIYLGILTDPSQNAKMVASLQANLQSIDSAPGQGPTAKKPSAPKRGIELVDETSKLDQMENK